MKYLEALTDQLEQDRNPAASIGRFLIASSNSPEFLAAHLRAFAEAAEADLKAERDFANRLLRSIKTEQRPEEPGVYYDDQGTLRNPDGSRNIFDDVDE